MSITLTDQDKLTLRTAAYGAVTLLAAADAAGSPHKVATNGSDQGITSVAELMHTARPVLLDLADRPDLRQTARDWRHRVNIHTAKTDQRPADVLLIRPDAHIAWATTLDEPADTAAPALRQALSNWFGTPRISRAELGPRRTR